MQMIHMLGWGLLEGRGLSRGEGANSRICSISENCKCCSWRRLGDVVSSYTRDSTAYKRGLYVVVIFN